MNITKQGIVKHSSINEWQYPDCVIPDTYQRVEYIQSDATSYINTGYGGTDLYQIDCKMECQTAVGNYWFGQQRAHGSMMYNGLYNNNSLEYNWLTVSRTVNNSILMTQQKISNTQVVISMNGVQYVRNMGTNDSTGNFLIFACNPSSSPVRYYAYPIKLYWFIMHIGDVVIRNFIPCYRKSDKVIGLWDTITQTFYTNAGTGTFTKGNDINATKISSSSICSNHIYEY